MSKQVLPHELAELITGLLIDPTLLGELDSPEKHQAFMLDIGRVIADHCGGKANWINPGDTLDNYLSNEYSSPYLSVSPDESLPSLQNNVWALYDPEGWDDGNELPEIATGSPLSEEAIETTRSHLRKLLVCAYLKTAPSQTDNPVWQNNTLQFSRLLSEIVAVANLTRAQCEAICQSMDLHPDELQELFVRAEQEFDDHKQALQI
jgi:hypothetical protein